MNTVYDWVTVAIFAGLVVLFLQRSTSDGPPRDSMFQYLVAMAGLAIANQFGNKAVESGSLVYHLLGAGLIAATLAYVHFTLRPLDKQ